MAQSIVMTYTTFDMKKILLMLMLPTAAFTQKTDVCKSDSVVAVMPGEGSVRIDRRECRMVLMSDSTYQALMVTAVQADSMRSAIPGYIEAVQYESETRKKAEEEMRRMSRIHEVTIAGYEDRLDRALDACSKTAMKLDDCEDELEGEKKRRRWAWFKGFGAGVLTGAAAVVTFIISAP